MNRAIASATSRSRAATPIRCANGATWASTNAAASRDSTNVASAIRRARQASRSPACTRAHTRGRRYFSSTAVASNRRPESVDRPIASANSAMQNSDTNGAPSPASRRPVSPAAVIQVAASPIDSGGCCSAQVTAASSRSRLRLVRGAGRSRANTQHVSRGVELPDAGACGRCHDPIQAATTDRNRAEFPAVEGNSRSVWCAPQVVPLAVRRTVLGLVCPLASLAARPPVVAVPLGVRPLVSSVRSLRSLLDHRWLRSSLRVRRLVSSVRSLRSLLDHLGVRFLLGRTVPGLVCFARCSTTCVARPVRPRRRRGGGGWSRGRGRCRVGCR